MPYLSKKELRDFSRKFVFKKQVGGREIPRETSLGTITETVGGRIKKSVLSLKEASRIVDRFVLPPDDVAKSVTTSFTETRVKLLKLCLKSNTPEQRWKKCRDFLIENINTQMPGNNVEHNSAVDNLMKSDSCISQCIQAIAFFNATDVNLPEGVILLVRPLDDTGKTPVNLSFPQHFFERHGTTLKAYVQDLGLIAEKYIDKNYPFLREELDNNYQLSCSILTDLQTGKLHILRHKDFFKAFNRQYPDLVKTYRLNSTMRPPEILNPLKTDAQRIFLQRFTSNEISEWKWEKTPISGWDIERIIKDYFPDIQGKVDSIKLTSIEYKPDNPLLNEKSLRYELADLYMEKLNLYERKKVLIGLEKNIKGFRLFRIKEFRDLIEELESDKNLERNILNLIRELELHYSKLINKSRKYDKWFEYVKITECIQQGFKPMKAYNIVAPEDKWKTVSKRYRRLVNEAKKQGFDVNDPAHVNEIKRKYGIPDIF